MKLRSLLGGLVALIATGTVAQAATLDATWNPGSALGAFNSGPAFSIQFDDDNGNGLFDVSEQNSFSGISVIWAGNTTSQLYTILGAVDPIAGFTDAPPASTFVYDVWTFYVGPGSGTFAQISTNSFIYSLSGLGGDPTVGDSTVVPVPAALPLLLSGIGALFAFRRRRAA